MTDPFSFGEPSTLHMRTGWGSRVVASWWFCMKLWFMNMPVAPESRSVDVEMDVSEVREVSSTWMLREQGEFLDRMQIVGGGTVARGFLTSLGAAFLLLLWDMGGLVRLQWYVQSKVSVLSNQGTHFTSCSFKNPPLQGFSHPPTHAEAS